MQTLDQSNPQLVKVIAEAIANSPEQRITFAEYMERVLYDPQFGYYATNQVQIGPTGDFYTAPHLGPDFGELLAEQFVQMWQVMGQPAAFTLVEMGAGQGLAAADILTYLQAKQPQFFAALSYLIVEKAKGLVAEQQQRLRDWVSQGKVGWSALGELAIAPIVGCLFSNELVDAFPVHRITLRQGKLQEIYVHLGADASPDSPFQEVIADPSTAQLNSYFELNQIDITSAAYPDEYSTEVNLAALSWLEAVAKGLQRGYLLTIDYGYPASQYYSPARSQGTLQCFCQHRSHANPYLNIGQQDITAHVNFTALEQQGQQSGLEQIGFTQQGLFLMGLGLGDRLFANNTGAFSADLAQVIQRREALHQFMNPMRLGGFGVLVQSKGLTPTEQAHPLRGLNPL
ncbi:MAG: SAM-dependent methyltransferase [Aphanocapsa sp. GSE-SYN-MK-11-07L]|nr:SAM-dependent methyltransferase [Aphanocapsa sp. GSE-SYN-MK-11-07L]